jgi:GNAT superfamily N-acetyltransferase
MKEETQVAIERFWAQDLGLSSGFNTQQVCCTIQHLYSGVQMFRRDGRVVIAVPEALHESIQSAICGLSPAELFSVEWLQYVLGRQAERILGPAEVNYADETSFRSGATEDGRALSDLDSEAYRLLYGALDRKEVEESGFSTEAFPAFGAFSNGILCAVASYTIWKPSIAHIIVATHPEHRRRGFAQMAVRSLAVNALSRGLILQWRTLAWNTNSLSLAYDLGFKHYCSTIYARCQYHGQNAH